MSTEHYQGLFYLAAGVGLFTVMLFVLRWLSMRSQGSDVSATPTHPWNQFEKIEIVKINQETKDIKSFLFRRLHDAKIPKFKPGQFLSFQIKNDSKVVRSYSISSTPKDTSAIQVSIKLVQGGVGSSWFHSLKVGDQVLAMAPSGHFVDSVENNQSERVFIAGGIGITPMFSIIQNHIENQRNLNMTLFYAARTRADLAFHEHFVSWSKQIENFKYFVVLSEEKGTGHAEGYLNFNYLKEKISDFKNKIYFLCGPVLMTDPLIDGLAANGIPEEHILNEKFVSPTVFDASLFPKRKLNVTFNGKKLDYEGNSNLLDFLESRGESLPYSCRSGVCGSCKCKTKGDVQALTDSGLTRTDKKAGYVLACVAYPKSDVDITS